MNPSTPTPTVTTAEQWSRYDRCYTCDVTAGQPCRNGTRLGGPERHRPHPIRLLRVDRNPAGLMTLARREYAPRTRPTIVRDYAHHVTVGGLTVCSAEPVVADTYVVLHRLGVRERCRRAPCKRHWFAEET